MEFFFLCILFGLVTSFGIPLQTFTQCVGRHEARIKLRQSSEYTLIPKGVVNLEVILSSIPYDVDLTISDYSTRNWIVFSCKQNNCQSVINSPSQKTKNWNNVTISYSGYRGLDSDNPGVEMIHITGTLQSPIRIGVKLNVQFVASAIPIALQFSWAGFTGCPVQLLAVDLKRTLNAFNHKTYRYRKVPTNVLVLRRGFSFQIDINLAVATTANTKVDTVPAVFGMVFSLVSLGEKKGITIIGKIAPYSPVGNYYIQIICNGGQAYVQFVILFNPYSASDPVHLPEKELLKETVENEEGIIWQGSLHQVFPVIFNYDHFEWPVLLTATHMLRRMPVMDRLFPILVSRHLSFAVNQDLCYGKWSGSYHEMSPGGYGCDEQIEGGPVNLRKECHVPTYWKSMAKFTDVFFSLRGAHRVQYCQCFVYAAVMTAVGRSLGIPTRPVTNYQSAHDKNRNRAVDQFFVIDNKGREIPYFPTHKESVWNFHVWNEMWMSRSDITSTQCQEMGLESHCADGWQVLDATPQEKSVDSSGVPENTWIEMLGPASVAMVKHGKTRVCLMNYHKTVDAKTVTIKKYSNANVGCFDTEFVISEVNANLNIWIKKQGETNFTQRCNIKDDPKRCGYPEDVTNHDQTVGQYISTKAPGPISSECRTHSKCDKERSDVTLAYKAKEPSYSTTRGRMMWAMSTSKSNPQSINNPQVGVLPYDLPMLVNIQGSIFSACGVVIAIPVAEADEVSCSVVITAQDYRGMLVKNGTYNESLVQDKTVNSKKVGDKFYCKFIVNRIDYNKYVSSQLNSDNVASSLKFHMFAVIKKDNVKTTFIEERMIPFCTPTEDSSVIIDSAKCKGNMGDFRVETRPACPTENTNIGNGVCESDLNNEANCYDGGDCCEISCLGMNAGVSSEENVDCSSNANCVDPYYQPNFEYTTKLVEPAISESGAMNCGKVKSMVQKILNQHCEIGKCSEDCQKALDKGICVRKLDSWFDGCVNASALVQSYKCDIPSRCKELSTVLGTVFHVYGANVDHATQPNITFETHGDFKIPQLFEKEVPERSEVEISANMSWIVAGIVGLIIGIVVGGISRRTNERQTVEISLL